jgi:hypothetical protein
MPTHDIIDNRQEKLVDHINRILGSTEAARFAVGYFFLSGLEPITAKLAGVKELRLLYDNSTDDEEKGRISLLERAFSGALTVAVRSAVNKMRRNRMTGPPLLRLLADLYHDHGMSTWLERAGRGQTDEDLPRVVCSEALLQVALWCRAQACRPRVTGSCARPVCGRRSGGCGWQVLEDGWEATHDSNYYHAGRGCGAGSSRVFSIGYRSERPFALSGSLYCLPRGFASDVLRSLDCGLSGAFASGATRGLVLEDICDLRSGTSSGKSKSSRMRVRAASCWRDAVPGSPGGYRGFACGFEPGDDRRVSGLAGFRFWSGVQEPGLVTGCPVAQ